ncbi:hypothetical protein [Fodinibius halophilus]|uniref:Uncharacterized protein n=1 Tax=Fodinibius halophilus TaxID=1736908 RepID=A0A6M1T1Z5_9BACT|nr:hypothetical protein [Fodinibius halophilus]NGP88037.1 hypothetical protein [Fodinibius halophilus]
MDSTVQQQKNFAIEFARKLASQDYGTAYTMTATGYKHSTSLEDMQNKFEVIVTDDWNIGQIVAGEYMASWPNKQPEDLGWVYVAISGDLYSEAITVTICNENDQLKIREVEFGRP